MMIFTPPEVLANLVAPWARFYSHSKTTATIVTFLHIAPLVVGGGVALLVNGVVMTRLERRLATPDGGTADRWRRLRGIAITSLTLWLAITFAGVALTNVG